ncbi:methyltransferase [Nonomuraea sp. K274]|uniref:Methyltransferase n=1 Tax=Nonomuraea cypriaca TaxID=1187855 RepID=A0A931AB39_9ACTN|nr:methyltransferase [Nonomuraea cypriaca]MBF8189596.1 methyltransferase [Nonomuraea cypriaca]
MADDSGQREVLAKLTGAWITQAVAAMAELGLADLLYDRRLTWKELARASGTHPDSLRRLLRLLAAHDLVEAGPAGTYTITPTGALLSRRHPDSLADLALFYAGPFYASWGALLHAVRTGRQGFEHVFGKPFFAYTAEHPEMGERFDRAMACGSLFFAQVPLVYDFTRHDVIVDLGGGNGALLAAILSQAPEARGILFDSAEVVGRVRATASTTGERCEVMAGDFFAEVPPGGDVYLLSRVLHDWDDERAGVLLGNCGVALAPGTRLLVVERLVPEHPAADPEALALPWDVHMLVNNGSGRERRLQEYTCLLDSAGFKLVDVSGLPLELNLLVAERR